MTAAIRKTPTSTNGGSGVGTTYTAALDTEIEALWAVSATYLISVAGTNTITATSDLSLVTAIGGYFRPSAFWLVPANSNTSSVTINIDGKGAKALVDKDGNALTANALVAARLHLIVYDGTNFRLFTTAPPANQPTPAPDMIVREEQTTGTDGGGFTSGSYVTRVLNVAVRNVISGASLATNQITLPAGTYCVQWSAPAYGGVQSHATRLFNVTDAAVIETGTAESMPATTNMTNRSFGTAVFTLGTSKAIRVEHRCQTTKTTNGLGSATGFAAKEVYTWVNIWKTA